MTDRSTPARLGGGGPSPGAPILMPPGAAMTTTSHYSPPPESGAPRTKVPPWGRGEDSKPILPMDAHWTDIPELFDRHP